MPSPRPFSVLQRAPCWRLLALVLTLAVLAAPVEAQGVEPFGVDITAATSQGTSTGGCVDYQVTVTNTGQSPIPQQHRIQLGLTQAPAGWRIEQPSPMEFQLAPSGERGSTLRLCPQGDLENGESASVTLTATVMDDPRNPRASDTQSFTATYESEGVFGFDLPDAAVYGAVVAVLGLLGVVLLTRRRPSAGIVVSCPEPAKEVLPNRGTSFPVRIRNEGRAKDVVTLTTSPVPRGWDTFLPLVDIPLEPREEQTVWLSVKSPADARPGDHVIVKVIARSTTGGAETAEIDTLTTVREPEPATQPPAAATRTAPPPVEVEIEEDERSVYGPEGEDPEERPRPVAVKRRKSA